MNKNENWKNDIDAAAEAYVQRDDVARERLERMKQEAEENKENFTIYFHQLEELLKGKEEELNRALRPDDQEFNVQLIEELTETRDQMRTELEKARAQMDEAVKASEKVKDRS